MIEERSFQAFKKVIERQPVLAVFFCGKNMTKGGE